MTMVIIHYAGVHQSSHAHTHTADTAATLENTTTLRRVEDILHIFVYSSYLLRARHSESKYATEITIYILVKVTMDFLQ